MRTSEKHFADEQWADFVRAVINRADHASMQKHLDSGCPRCREAVHLLAGVSRVASNSRLEVPKELTLAALALFKPPSSKIARAARGGA